MKKNIAFWGIILLSINCLFAQKKAKADSIPLPMYKIVFNDAFRTDTFDVDSSNFQLHILNPATLGSPWFSYLTRSAYPLEWLQLTRRNKVNDYFYPSWSLQPYMTYENNNLFYQTNRQYSDLSYKTSGNDNNNEEFLNVLHTQNLTRRSNIGLHFNLNSSLLKIGANPRFEDASDNALNVFYRYSGKNYRGFYRFYLNSLKMTETGGLVDDNSLDYSSAEPFGQDVRLNGPRTHMKKTGFVMTQELDFYKTFSEANTDTTSKDSLVSKKKTFGSVMYVLGIETNKRTYNERVEETGFYNQFYSRDRISNDSIVLNKLSNRLSLQSPYIIKYLPDLSIAIVNDIYSARFGMDTTFIGNNLYKLNNRKENYQQTWISANVRQKFGYIDWEFYWDSYLLGYGSGDQQIKAIANLYANQSKSMALQLMASSSLKTPSFMLLRNFSNHFNYSISSWNREKRQELSGTLKIGGRALELTGTYILNNDFIYFDTAAMPKQAPQMNIVSGELSSEVKFWKFKTINKATWQETDGDEYVHVPRWMLFHSMNFQHTFHFKNTGGKLYTQLGYDITYTSAFKAAAYMPATGVFFIQNNKEIGNYAKIDLHLTMKVKTVSFFLKLSHVNAASTARQFTANHYPMMPMVFSYGINWLFYD